MQMSSMAHDSMVITSTHKKISVIFICFSKISIKIYFLRRECLYESKTLLIFNLIMPKQVQKFFINNEHPVYNLEVLVMILYMMVTINLSKFWK